MNPFVRSCALTLLILALASTLARAQYLEYFGSGAIVGTTGPAPALLDPETSVVDYSYIFDSSAGPIATTSVSATYAGVYGVAGFSDSDIRPLSNITLTITKDPVNESYVYTFIGVTPEGWEVVHSAFSTSPEFVPNLSLPTSSPPYPDGADFAAGYVDVNGPGDAWAAYSDADIWFDVATIVPQNRARGGKASASKQRLLLETAAQAFDGLKITKWFASYVSTAWLQYQFGSGAAWAVVRYDITSAIDVANRDPRDWQLQGSHDGVTWTTLDSRTGELFSARCQTKRYTFANSIAYEYYRLKITATRGAGGGIQLAELGLFAF